MAVLDCQAIGTFDCGQGSLGQARAFESGWKAGATSELIGASKQNLAEDPGRCGGQECRTSMSARRIFWRRTGVNTLSTISEFILGFLQVVLCAVGSNGLQISTARAGEFCAIIQRLFAHGMRRNLELL